MATSPTTATGKPILHYRDRAIQFFREERLIFAPEITPLNLVYIPPGHFQMGSPEAELGHQEHESPQHRVTLAQPWFMSQHPITQAQWRAVATLPRVERDLKLEPSKFQGDNRPVERVSWFDAVEFCQRLTQGTGRAYRLPTEAEWEYACRAGTTTPFHFGKTITTDLANYRGQDWEIGGKTYPGAYGSGPYGEFREETTDVGSFPANAFGLYDLHGNVCEWCVDHWHENYKGAPADGSAWVAGGDVARRVLRGGAWSNYPENCRSAYRGGLTPVGTFDFVGFRVVCGLATG